MIWVRVQVLRVRWIFFSVNKDDGASKKSLMVSPSNDNMPPHLAIVWSIILWVIDVGVEFFDQSNVYLLF